MLANDGTVPEYVFHGWRRGSTVSAIPLPLANGGEMAIGRDIVTVQGVFGKVFNEGTEFERDGSQFDRLLEDGDELMIGDIPLRRLGLPQEVAETIFFLCSTQSSYVTGAEVHVNGGQHV